MPYRVYILLLFIISIFFCTPKKAVHSVEHLGADEGKLVIASWPGYVEMGNDDDQYDWVTEFEKNSSCKVQNVVFKSEEDIAKMMDEGIADLFILSSDLVLKYAREEKLYEINFRLIPNWETVDTRVRYASWFKILDKSFGVPIDWSANYLIYNKNYFPKDPDSWDILYQEMKLSDGRSSAKRVQSYGSPVSIADAALYLKYGRPELKIDNIMNLNEVQYKAVFDLLRQQQSVINGYWTDAMKQVQGFRTGSFAAGVSWPFQLHELKKEGMRQFKITIPKEGVTGWADAILMPKSAKNINCAYKYMNHSLSRKVQGDMASWTGTVPVVPGACFEKGSLINPETCTENGFYHYDRITFLQSLERCSSFNPCVSYERWQKDFLFLKLGMYGFLP